MTDSSYQSYLFVKTNGRKCALRNPDLAESRARWVTCDRRGFLAERRNRRPRREGGGRGLRLCARASGCAHAYRCWTGDRIQRHGDAHPLAGNNVTRLPVRHRHVHALDWLDPAFRVSQRPPLFPLISADSQLRKKISRIDPRRAAAIYAFPRVAWIINPVSQAQGPARRP